MILFAYKIFADITPCPRSVVVVVLCGSSCEEIPHIQGQRNPIKMVGAGAAVRRYAMSKGKEEAPARLWER